MPSGKIPKSLPSFRTRAALSIDSSCGASRSTGITPAPLKNQATLAVFTSSTLASQQTCRQNTMQISTGSIAATWLEAMIAPRSRGTLDRPRARTHQYALIARPIVNHMSR